MKLNYFFSLIVLVISQTMFGKTIVNGYYITNNGDIVKSKFVIKDLFTLHKQIVCVDSIGNQIPLTPYDIESFTFRIANYIDDSQEYNEVDHTYDHLLINKGYLYKKRAFSLDAEINAEPFLGDSVENYRSIDIGGGKRLFLSTDNNDKYLQTAVYHTKLHSDNPYLTSTIWLIIRHNQIFECGDRKLNDWVSEAVIDYKTLSLMIKTKIIRAFPWDFELVVNDYNNWLVSGKPDTTFYLKGFIDAQQNYGTVVPFSLSYFTGTAFFFPGLITAVIVAHHPKESNIKVPGNSQVRNNHDYISGFRHKAYNKKYRATANGSIFGGLTCIGLLILLL